jgi:hydrogenase nickel incorporation protein HypA/HybF
MHELSIATSIVESVAESAAAYPRARVLEVRIRIGALASVVEDSLQFCWGIVTERTPLASSKLIVYTLPVVIHCVSCNTDSEIQSIQRFHCPRCGQVATQFRQGRELDIESIKLEDPESAEPQKVEEPS